MNYRTGTATATTYDRIVKEATTGNYNQKADYHADDRRFYWGSDFLGQVEYGKPDSAGRITIELRGGATVTDTPEAAIATMVESYKSLGGRFSI